MFLQNHSGQNRKIYWLAGWSDIWIRKQAAGKITALSAYRHSVSTGRKRIVLLENFGPPVRLQYSIRSRIMSWFNLLAADWSMAGSSTETNALSFFLYLMPIFDNSRLTVGQFRQSGLIWFWKDRDDIQDSSAYARKLREQAQTRRPYDFAG